MATEDTALVGEFCAQLRALQADDDQAVQSALNAALEQLRGSGESPAAVVGAFLQALGQPDNLRTVDVFAPPSPPPQGDYGCPRQVCNRRADGDPGAPLPVCDVYRQSMIYRP